MKNVESGGDSGSLQLGVPDTVTACRDRSLFDRRSAPRLHLFSLYIFEILFHGTLGQMNERTRSSWMLAVLVPCVVLQVVFPCVAGQRSILGHRHTRMLNDYTGCGNLTTGLVPSKSDGLAGVSAQLAEAVYSDDVPSYQRDVQSLLGASCVDILYNDEDAEVGVAVNDDSIFFTFRGSESVQDWVKTNVNSAFANVTQGDKTVEIHQGFFNAWRAAETKILNITAQYPGRDVYLSGHSLGGALAQLGAFMLEQENNVPVAAVYTFGSPPVGGENWKTAVTSSGLGDKIINFIHPDDPVPFIQYAVDSPLLTVLLGALAPSIELADNLRDFRLAGRSVSVTDSSCEELDPEYNDFGWRLSVHLIAKYNANVAANCISRRSDIPTHPDCVPASAVPYSGTCSGDLEPSSEVRLAEGAETTSNGLQDDGIVSRAMLTTTVVLLVVGCF